MYEILIAPSAIRDYKKLPNQEVLDINDAIDALADDPRPPNFQ